MGRTSAVWMGLCAALVMMGPLSAVGAQSTGTALGSVRVPQQAKIGDQTLSAGTYTVRATNDPVEAVVGQGPESHQWVELVQGGQTRARLLATKLMAADVQEVAETAPPAQGASRIDVLKGGDYVRIWINQGGTHYLLHLAIVPR